MPNIPLTASHPYDPFEFRRGILICRRMSPKRFLLHQARRQIEEHTASDRRWHDHISGFRERYAYTTANTRFHIQHGRNSAHFQSFWTHGVSFLKTALSDRLTRSPQHISISSINTCWILRWNSPKYTSFRNIISIYALTQKYPRRENASLRH